MIFDEVQFLKAIEESFSKYKEYGARSTQKLKPIHKFVAEVLFSIWGQDYGLHYMCDSNSEFTVEGKYYPKDIDITITKDGKPVFCLGIKFVTSNYKQNANNYFENMMGETANIQSLGNLPYAHLIILRRETPYFKKNEFEIPSKMETINDKDISKYLRLVFDSPQAHRPDYLGIQLVDIDEKSGKISAADLDQSFSEEICKCLRGKLSIEKFFGEIAEYKDYLNVKK
jgi:hypothetical protein